MLFLRIILFFAFIGIISITADLEFNNVICFTYDKQFMEYEYCYLKAVNRSYKYFSLKAVLHKLPIYTAKVVFKIAKRDTRNIFEHFNGSINACKFLKDQKNPLASLIFSTFAPYSNLNHTCPFTHDIILDKLPIQYVNSVVKNFFPFGRYLLNLTFYNENIPRSDIIVYFTNT
ncbi:PREDICTED: uncharacterized protein LOC108614843 [Drosophila arizonae]|uniref:Uncharacterized protein LOC108614843 n=1 Tax=Drosophila arizonae TaxID=7263 RepID=A0ABM1PBG7_DROAR|nr:PREDICTED: uncharacterized protein LOC108614843 [Drosophila arizonae]